MATRKLNVNLLNFLELIFWSLSRRSLAVYDCPGFRAPLSGMNSMVLSVSHLEVPFRGGLKVSIPSLMSAPAVAPGIEDASSTLIVDLSEMIPPVCALMKVANSVLCPLLLPYLLQEKLIMASMNMVTTARILLNTGFISACL